MRAARQGVVCLEVSRDLCKVGEEDEGKGRQKLMLPDLLSLSVSRRDVVLQDQVGRVEEEEERLCSCCSAPRPRGSCWIGCPR